MKHFKIGQFEVDTSRCRVSTEDYEVILEPKVMDVLQFLYQHHGQVISQEQMFSAVWPNATFNPSSVQRAMAVLRKAFKEDSKNATLFITHPKRGYSLELPEPVITTTKSHQLHYFVAALFVVSLMVIGYLSRPATVKTEFAKLLPITSTDDNESYLTLSPDGKYLAFVRGDNADKAIWLKEVSSNSEVELTQYKSNFSSLGWRADSSALAYVEKSEQQTKLKYMVLDKVTMKAVRDVEVYQFSELSIMSNKLQWAKNHAIYFIDHNPKDNSTRLSYVDIKTSSKTQLVAAEGQEWLLRLALSPSEQSIALGYEMGLNKYQLAIFDLATQQVNKLAIIEDSIQGLSWHPNNQTLLVSNRSQLQLVDMKGEVSMVDFDNYQFIRDAQFSPNGSEIFMELRNVDVDILRKKRDPAAGSETIIDTSSLDFFPIYSPDDSQFVFESHRTGLKQLYLYKDGQQKMIFANPNNEELFGSVWTPDGREVIAASKNKLFRINVANATYVELPHAYQPFGLREHFKHEDALLVSYRAEDGSGFHPAKLDLTTMELTTYSISGQPRTCHVMALDHQDNVYLANNKQVVKVLGESGTENIWQQQQGDIQGLRVQDNQLSLMLQYQTKFELTHINLATGSQEVIHQGVEDGTMLTNSSNDEQQFLYLSEPKRTSRLVRLQ